MSTTRKATSLVPRAPVSLSSLASQVRRELADLIDIGVAIVAALLLFPVLLLVFPTEGPRSMGMTVVLVVIGVALLAYWLIRALMESSSLQGGIGLLAAGLRVEKPDGGRISFWTASVRCLTSLALRVRLGHVYFCLSVDGKDPEEGLFGWVVVNRGPSVHLAPRLFGQSAKPRKPSSLRGD